MRLLKTINTALFGSYSASNNTLLREGLNNNQNGYSRQQTEEDTGKKERHLCLVGQNTVPVRLSRSGNHHFPLYRPEGRVVGIGGKAHTRKIRQVWK